MESRSERATIALTPSELSDVDLVAAISGEPRAVLIREHGVPKLLERAEAIKQRMERGAA